MKETGGPLHGASVLIVELGRSTISDDDGAYEFERVPPGEHHVIAHLDGIFTGAAKVVTVEAGVDVTADFLLELLPQRYEITVTSGEKQETAFEAFQSVESIAAYDLAESTVVSLGETLDHMVGTGIAVSRRKEMHRHPHRACVVLSRLGRVDQCPWRSQRRFRVRPQEMDAVGPGRRGANR